MSGFERAMKEVAAREYGLRDNFYNEQSDPIALAILAMPELVWIRQALHDILNSDFLGDYQRQLLVGAVPAAIVEWADLDPADFPAPAMDHPTIFDLEIPAL